MEGKQKIIAVAGPTASGKTGLSIALAKRFKGEIISADSMQVYKGLDIGTAKATREEQFQAPHHLIDILPPDAPYSVSDFVEMAGEKVREISARGNLPILAGGTGLYIESFLKGVKFAPQPDNRQLKRQLKRELAEKGRGYMYSVLKEIDPEYAASVHENNTARVLRGIEVYRLTGENMTRHRQNTIPEESPYDYLIIGLTCADRAKLYDNINRRVDAMLSSGLLGEAEYVWKNRQIFKTCTAAIGYKEFFAYFEGKAGLDRCAEKLKQASRNYAKRQLTWFNRMKDINWLYVDSRDYVMQAIEMAKNFLGN